MKNKINIILNNKSIVYIFCLIFFLNYSCSNDFLDEPKNTNGISEDVVFSSRSNVEAFVNGIYGRYKGQWDSDIADGVNTSNVDTGGLYALYFARTIKGNDLIQAPSWFLFDYAHENREPTYRRTNFNWFFNYQCIYYTNLLLEGLEKSDLDETTKTEYTAIGKVIRAFHYFQLALEFAPNYNNDRTLERIPLVTQTGLDPQPPVSLETIYSFILTELNQSVSDVPITRNGKGQINQAVAYGILTRVLQVTQDDWQAVSDAAKMAYGNDANSAVITTNWGTGFNDLSDDEWLWGHSQDGVNETNFFWMSPPVMTDHLTLSYQATYINPSFNDEFSNTDVRKLFFDIYGVSNATPYREFITTKFSFDFDSDVPLMRKSEMVLADAEAQYHLGFEPQARTLLYTLQSARDSNAVMPTSSGPALLEEILLERRKELYGELGVEWFDAKRYRRAINRDPEHRVVVNIPVDSELFYLKIPQDEIDLNPNYSGFNNN